MIIRIIGDEYLPEDKIVLAVVEIKPVKAALPMLKKKLDCDPNKVTLWPVGPDGRKPDKSQGPYSKEKTWTEQFVKQGAFVYVAAKSDDDPASPTGPSSPPGSPDGKEPSEDPEMAPDSPPKPNESAAPPPPPPAKNTTAPPPPPPKKSTAPPPPPPKQSMAPAPTQAVTSPQPPEDDPPPPPPPEEQRPKSLGVPPPKQSFAVPSLSNPTPPSSISTQSTGITPRRDTPPAESHPVGRYQVSPPPSQPHQPAGYNPSSTGLSSNYSSSLGIGNRPSAIASDAASAAPVHTFGGSSGELKSLKEELSSLFISEMRNLRQELQREREESNQRQVALERRMDNVERMVQQIQQNGGGRSSSAGVAAAPPATERPLFSGSNGLSPDRSALAGHPVSAAVEEKRASLAATVSLYEFARSEVENLRLRQQMERERKELAAQLAAERKEVVSTVRHASERTLSRVDQLAREIDYMKSIRR